MFDSRFISDEAESLGEFLSPGAVGLRGRIVLGDHAEEFVALLAAWQRPDYERHWRDAADRLLAGHDRSAFFSSAFEFRWTCWREGDRVRVQEHYLGADGFPEAFDPHDLFTHIRDPDDGPSEWNIGIADLAAFLART